MRAQKILIPLLSLLLLVCCTGEKEPAARPESPSPESAPNTAVTETDEFLGLAFYPGSEDKAGIPPGETIPSVRLTADSPAQVLEFYKPKIGELRETNVGEAVILTGTTSSGEVQVTVEPFEGKTQVMISRKK